QEISQAKEYQAQADSEIKSGQYGKAVILLGKAHRRAKQTLIKTESEDALIQATAPENTAAEPKMEDNGPDQNGAQSDASTTASSTGRTSLPTPSPTISPMTSPLPQITPPPVLQSTSTESTTTVSDSGETESEAGTSTAAFVTLASSTETSGDRAAANNTASVSKATEKISKISEPERGVKNKKQRGRKHGE
ncbi:MAG: hypothetical protein QOG91_84, partial [Candidatus Parcubacteria bacterium]|nr:hypothetical protein [Candidatus Parcubacteria bacterium]